MRKFLLILCIITSCLKKEPVNNEILYQISIISLKESDKPNPVIILTNQQNDKPKFPEHYYQLKSKDLKIIEEKCNSIGSKNKLQASLLIEIKKGVKLNKYFFNKNNGIYFLNYVKSQTIYNQDKNFENNILFIERLTMD